MTLPGGYVSDLDQMEAWSESIAKIVATYYHALIKAGLETALAERLTADYNSIFWTTTMGNASPGNQKEDGS